MQDHLELHGCRHAIPGHYLKAIGLLRVLAQCAAPEHRDPDAEGWWDSDKACFCLRSQKYPTRGKLVEFFVRHYRPTPVFAAWNKEPGSDANVSEQFGVRPEWEVANTLPAQVVSAEDRKKAANKDKLIASINGAWIHGEPLPIARQSDWAIQFCANPWNPTAS